MCIIHDKIIKQIYLLFIIYYLLFITYYLLLFLSFIIHYLFFIIYYLFLQCFKNKKNKWLKKNIVLQKTA
jgi:hypothetical protein